MTSRRSLILLLATTIAACSDAIAPNPVQPPAEGLLKDVELSSLPSPYYHFEYDADGRVSLVGFASGIRTYVVAYEGDRISEMDEVSYFNGTILGTADRLVYQYDDAGRVDMVSYRHPDGLVFTTVQFVYESDKLKGIVRSRLVDGALLGDKTMAFSYYADGNLERILEHLLPVDGQPDVTFIDRFEEYDDGINVDGFDLLHDEFFDHVLLLPGVQLQIGNPGRQIRSGDGTNFEVEYTYAYDDSGRPLTKNGLLTILNGSDTGRVITISSEFSYY